MRRQSKMCKEDGAYTASDHVADAEQALFPPPAALAAAANVTAAASAAGGGKSACSCLLSTSPRPRD